MRRDRSSFSFADFNLRRLLLHGARAARGSPPLSNRCDIEKGASSSSKAEKSSSSNSKVSCGKLNENISCIYDFLQRGFLNELHRRTVVV